jgi:segregation and condensation protein A
MECTVKVEIFEGPLDLLLHLIRKNEIDIYDIPMALITQQYLEYLGWMQSLDLDIASDYLVMAATLVHIKSRMILPTTSVGGEGGEESDELEDPRAELVKRLLEYQKYKEAAGQLGSQLILERDVFVHPTEKQDVEDGLEEAALFEEADLFHLLEAFRRIMSARQWDGLSMQVELERVSLADRIREISEALEENPRGLRFEALFPLECSRMDLVITFLALLEMIKMRMIRAYQTAAYGTIHVMRAASESSSASPSPEGIH